MANKALFRAQRAEHLSSLPKADTLNAAGGLAYGMPPKQALAQYALTGTLANTYYAAAETQLDVLMGLCAAVEPSFIAKLALYAREHGYMKDLPAFLVAWLYAKDPQGPYFSVVFPRVVDNGKMLCNFVQILRSGVLGRKTLASRGERVVNEWFNARSDEQVFRASVGTAKPSLADVIRLAHPKPKTDSRRSLYGYLSGKNPTDKPFNVETLPEVVKQIEAFKADPENLLAPDVPWLLLTALPLSKRHWTEIALRAPWHTLRMNLNTFLRHGVFEDQGVVFQLAKKLRDEESIRKARVFPYQLLAAYLHVEDKMPSPLVEALHDAMELAVVNVPTFEGKVVVCPDVSGSMRSAVTGSRPGGTSKMRCVDIAALIAAAIVRKNPDAVVMPFEQRVILPHEVNLNRNDSIMENAKKLGSIGGGGTSCSAPLRLLNETKGKPDLVIFVSDNESWVDNGRTYSYYHHATSVVTEWNNLVQRHPSAKMVCIDIQPNKTTQAPDDKRILNVGGFSDTVFEIVSSFAKGELSPAHWVGRIEEVQF